MIQGSGSPPPSIGQLLTLELAELDRFRSLLAEEQALLQNGDAEHLPQLIEKKSALAARLGSLLHEREQALTILGFNGGRDGMESWLATQPPRISTSAREEWQHLLALANAVRNEHEINGKLIALRLQHNQQALAALMSAGVQTLTYGPDGQQRLGTSGRTLGSA